MADYVRRLQLCGYRMDDAWTIASDFFRILDFDALEAFVEAKELVQRVGTVR